MKWLTKPPLGAKINWSHPLAKGLVGFWLMNEGGGDCVYDLSGNNKTGVLTGMALPPTATSGWNPSRNGVGLAFDGTDDYVNIANNVNPTAVTLCAWIKTSSSSSSGNAAIVARWKTGSLQRVFLLTQTLTTNVLLFTTSSDGSYQSGNNVLSSSVANTNKWIFACGVYDNIYNRIYVNGVLENLTDRTNDGIYSTTLNTLIGSQATSFGTYFNGLIDDVRIYNRALSAQEVQELYINPYGMFEFAPRWLGAEISTFTQGKAMRGLLNRSML